MYQSIRDPEQLYTATPAYFPITVTLTNIQTGVEIHDMATASFRLNYRPFIAPVDHIDFAALFDAGYYVDNAMSYWTAEGPMPITSGVTTQQDAWVQCWEHYRA